MCQEFCSRGGVPGQVPPQDQVHPPTRYIPQDQVHPQTRYTPLGLGTPPGAGTPLWTRYTPLGPGTFPRDQVHSPGTRYTPWDQVPPPGPATPPGSSACREIRATSGRYASYWNAFLYLNFFYKKVLFDFSFRQDSMKCIPSLPHQNILAKLQLLFAHLSISQVNYFSYLF